MEKKYNTGSKLKELRDMQVMATISHLANNCRLMARLLEDNQ